MAGENRTAAHPIGEPAEPTSQQINDLLTALAERPYDFDFFQVLRRLECLFTDYPRIAMAAAPADEPLRFGQEPSLAFAPRTIAGLRPPTERQVRPWLTVFFFGVFGPNGPMPLHITDFIHNRARNEGDSTLARFADVFHHRLLELFYRAWASSEPVVQFDRPDIDHFSRHLGSMFGVGSPALADRNGVHLPDVAKLYYAGLLSAQTNSAEGLRVLLQDFLALPVEIDQFVGQWLTLDPQSMTRLGETPKTGSLGHNAVIGSRVWDRQHKFRIRLGPLEFADYRRFLPGGRSLERLVALVRNYGVNGLDWDLELILKKEQVPALHLGNDCALGFSTWTANNPFAEDQDQLKLNAVSYVHNY